MNPLRINSFRPLYLFAALLLTPMRQVQAAEPALPDFTGLVDSAGPAVVSIEANHEAHTHKSAATAAPDDGFPEGMPEIFRHLFGDLGQVPEDSGGTALGSGFLISSDGKILTNRHVVDGADEVVVHLSDRRELTAKVIGSDPLSDVALLKVKASGLPFLKLGNAKELKPGQWVIAIGSPFGLDHSVSAGIVSAIGRRSLDPSQQYVPFIQTDVAINRGNSGGPLLNLHGEVVGINSQIFSSSGGFQGVSFAIPIETAMNAVQQLQATGKVSRGQLGVHIQEVDRAMVKQLGLDRTSGALVNGVEPGSAAAKAGFRAGDVIIAFDGQDVASASDLPPLVGAIAPGSHASVRVVRDGKIIELPVVLDRLATDSTAAAAPASERNSSSHGNDTLGLAVQDLAPDQRKALALPAAQGVLIGRVGSDAARRAGLQAGDVILKLGHRDIASAAQLGAAARELKPGDTAMLLVRRADVTRFVAVPIGSVDE
jgi:serine protease Do